MTIAHRVFRMEVHVGGEEGDLADLGPESEHRQVLFDGFAKWMHQVQLWGSEFDKDGERRHRRSITVEAVGAVWDQHLMHVECAIGREGVHVAARAPGRRDLAIWDRAAESPRHVTILLPTAPSAVCILVAESDGGSDPKTRLEWLIKKATQAARRDSGSGPGRPPKLVPILRQIADPQHVGQMLQQANRIGARFDQREVGQAGGPEVDVRRRQLTLSLGDGAHGQNWLMDKLQYWLNHQTSKKDAMAELDLLLVEDERGKYDEVDFIVTADGRQMHIALEDLLEQSFSYFVSDNHPTLDHWFEQVYEKAGELARLARTECVMPLPSAVLDDLKEELELCQIDSPSAASEAESTGDSASGSSDH